LTVVPTEIRPAGPRSDPPVVGGDSRGQVYEAYRFESLEGDPELKALVRFAARLCDAPVALIGLLEQDSFHFLARVGTDTEESPYSTSFCAHVMLHDDLMQVLDASADPRFADNPLVLGEPHVRFYAGYPLISEEGLPLGTLAVVDTAPRSGGLNDFQREGLAVLAQSVMRRMRSRRHSRAARREADERESYMRSLADSIPAIAWSASPDGHFEYFNKRMVDFTGLPDDQSGAAFHPDDFEKATKAWQRSLATGEIYELEHRFRRHDGEYRWMIARAVPVRDPQGHIHRWFGTAVDIHDLHAASEARDLLVRELSHRIKNIFAVVSGLVSMSVRRRPELQAFGDELIGSIRALGRAHDYVRRDGERRNTLHGILEDLFVPYGSGEGARVAIAGDDVAIASQAATPLALVFHELATNSAKYGALSAEDGAIDLSISDGGDDTLSLCWIERGGPKPKSKRTEGFGSRLVEMSITGPLGGKWERRFEPDGLICKLTVSKAAIAP
jgi:PAS domain S-box-containing protein